MPSLISVLPFSELLSPFPHLIFFLEFSQRFSIFLGFLFDPPFSLFSQSFGNFLLPGPYFSLLPPLLFFVFIPTPELCVSMLCSPGSSLAHLLESLASLLA